MSIAEKFLAGETNLVCRKLDGDEHRRPFTPEYSSILQTKIP